MPTTYHDTLSCPAPPLPPVATYARTASSDSVSKRTAVVDEKARTRGGCPVAGSAGGGVEPVFVTGGRVTDTLWLTGPNSTLPYDLFHIALRVCLDRCEIASSTCSAVGPTCFLRQHQHHARVHRVLLAAQAAAVRPGTRERQSSQRVAVHGCMSINCVLDAATGGPTWISSGTRAPRRLASPG